MNDSGQTFKPFRDGQGGGVQSFVADHIDAVLDNGRESAPAGAAQDLPRIHAHPAAGPSEDDDFRPGCPHFVWGDGAAAAGGDEAATCQRDHFLDPAR